jgi:hypothetical protein
LGQNVVVRTDADQGQTIRLAVMGSVQPPWSPAYRDLRVEYPALPADRGEIGQQFLIETPQPLEVSHLSVRSPTVPSYIRVIAERYGKQYFRVNVAVDAKTAPAEFDQEIVMEVPQRAYTPYRFALHGRQAIPYEVYPAKIFAAAVDAGTTFTRPVRILSKGSKVPAPRVSAIDLLPPGHSTVTFASVTEGETELVGRISVTAPDRAVAGEECRGHVRLSVADGRVLEIPLVYFIRP